MKIVIESIPHDQHRYATVGDWYTEGDTLHIKVSQMKNPSHEILVALHELVEVILCKDRGVTQESVDAFDKAFELNRLPGDESEPGDDPDAPYRQEHFFATNIERLMAGELGVDWADYETSLSAL